MSEEIDRIRQLLAPMRSMVIFEEGASNRRFLVAGGQMRLFLHLIYEYRKGLRKLVLYTTRKALEDPIRAKLLQHHIPYLIHDIGHGKINVYFGDVACVEVVRAIGKHNVARYTDEEDFILGAMLGYDIVQQCRRYVKRRKCLSESDGLRPQREALT